MGYTLAGAFIHEGHSVILVSGPTHLDVPENVDFIPVETAAEMHDVVSKTIGRVDIAVFAAAVADYTPVITASEKIKKSGDRLTLELIRTADILGSARHGFGFTGTLVGFAAETENLEANTREKLAYKHCDLIIANDVSQAGIGFDSDENQVLLVYRDRIEFLPKASKHALSLQLVDAILALTAAGL